MPEPVPPAALRLADHDRRYALRAREAQDRLHHVVGFQLDHFRAQ
jgi:hypothetical protein